MQTDHRQDHGVQSPLRRDMLLRTVSNRTEQNSLKMPCFSHGRGIITLLLAVVHSTALSLFYDMLACRAHNRSVSHVLLLHMVDSRYQIPASRLEIIVLYQKSSKNESHCSFICGV